MVLYPLTGYNQWTKCHPLILIFLDDTWDTKSSHGPVCFSHPSDGSWEKMFHKLFFRQRVIQLNIVVIFWGTGRSIADFYK